MESQSVVHLHGYCIKETYVVCRPAAIKLVERNINMALDGNEGAVRVEKGDNRPDQSIADSG